MNSIKKRVIGIFFVLTLFIFIISFSFAYKGENDSDGFFKKIISSITGKATSSYEPTGQNFSKIVGYYNPLSSGGEINLWLDGYQFFIYNSNLLGWEDRTGSLEKIGVPANFEPVVGYYHPFKTGRLHLWSEDGTLIVYNPDTKKWTDWTGTYTSRGLPSDFKPVVGYYHPFGGGRIHLWDANGKFFIYNPVQDRWFDRTGPGTNQTIGLPKGFKPVVGYYHPFSGGRINLFDASGQLFIYNPNTNTWIDRTGAIPGLPKGKAPKAGYYDELSKKIVLIYDEGIFTSHESANSVFSLDSEYFSLNSSEIRLVEPKCFDSDGGSDPFVFGYVEYSSNGEKKISYDSCVANLLYEKICKEGWSFVADPIHCDDFGMICSKGVCVNETSDVDILSSRARVVYLEIGRNNADKFFMKEPIKGFAYAVDSNYQPITSEDGWDVQYYIYDTLNDSNYLYEYIPSGNYNAVYNFERDAWGINAWAPSKPGNYYMRVMPYCSKNNSKCWNSSNGNSLYGDNYYFYFEVLNESYVSLSSCNAVTNFMESPSSRLSIDGQIWDLRHSFWDTDWENNSYFYSSWEYSQYYNFGSRRAFASLNMFEILDKKNLESALNNALENGLCNKREIAVDENYSNYQTVYICKDIWSLVREYQEVSSSRDPQIYNNDVLVIWFNENKLFNMRFSTNEYYYCSSSEECRRVEEGNMIRQQSDLIKFVEKLVNNEATWTGGGYLDYNSEPFVRFFLNACNSQVSKEEFWTSSWFCKQEPVICPPHGEQKLICSSFDYSSGEDIFRESFISCNPGICSGCMVPKWFDSRFNTKCIEYGFRFEQSRGEKGTVTWYEGEGYGDDILINITQDGSAYLKFGEGDGSGYWSWVAFEGIIHEGKKYYFSWPYTGEGGNSGYFIVEEIVSASSNREGYIKFSFSVEEIFNAYCDIDGAVKGQKSNMLRCQNNYECFSNECRSGLCVDTYSLVVNQSGLLARIWCRLSNLFSSQEEYEKCIAVN
jgi:hypothetical protein